MPREPVFELERLVFFSDAVFAIAITLLVVDIRIPGELVDQDVVRALVGILPHGAAFALSFAVHRHLLDRWYYPYPWWIIQIPLSNAIKRDSGSCLRNDEPMCAFLSPPPFGLMVHLFTIRRCMAS